MIVKNKYKTPVKIKIKDTKPVPKQIELLSKSNILTTLLAENYLSLSLSPMQVVELIPLFPYAKLSIKHDLLLVRQTQDL